jgi:hypothetical protein
MGGRNEINHEDCDNFLDGSGVLQPGLGLVRQAGYSGLLWRPRAVLRGNLVFDRPVWLLV